MALNDGRQNYYRIHNDEHHKWHFILPPTIVSVSFRLAGDTVDWNPFDLEMRDEFAQSLPRVSRTLSNLWLIAVLVQEAKMRLESKCP